MHVWLVSSEISAMLVSVWDMSHAGRGDTAKEPLLICFGICINVIIAM